MMKFNDLKQGLKEALIELAATKQTKSFRGMMFKLGLTPGTNDYYIFEQALIEIGEEEAFAKRPFINALLIDPKTNLPNKGFNKGVKKDFYLKFGVNWKSNNKNFNLIKDDCFSFWSNVTRNSNPCEVTGTLPTFSTN